MGGGPGGRGGRAPTYTAGAPRPAHHLPPGRGPAYVHLHRAGPAHRPAALPPGPERPGPAPPAQGAAGHLWPARRWRAGRAVVIRARGPRSTFPPFTSLWSAPCPARRPPATARPW